MDRRPALRGAALFEAYNKGLSLAADQRAAVPSAARGTARGQHEGGRIRRARGARRGVARADPVERSDVIRATSRPREAIDWYWRPTNQVRASWRPSPRPGSSGSPGATAIAASTTSLSVSSRRRCSRSDPTPRDQFRHRLLSRYRGHGLLGREPVRPRSGWGSGGRRHGRGDPDWAAGAELRAELEEEGCIVPVDGRGHPRRSLHRRRELPMLDAAEARGRRRRRAGRHDPGSRSWPRSTRSSGIASSCGRASASTTSGRSTSPRRSAAGATTSCRSSSAIDWSAGSSRGSIGKADTLRIVGRLVGGRVRPAAEEGFVDAFVEAIEPIGLR